MNDTLNYTNCINSVHRYRRQKLWLREYVLVNHNYQLLIEICADRYSSEWNS